MSKSEIVEITSVCSNCGSGITYKGPFLGSKLEIKCVCGKWIEFKFSKEIER